MANLVEIEDEIQLAYVAEELIQHFYEEVDGFQIGQLVVVGIDTGAEEETGVATVDDLATAAELDEVGLMFLIAGGDEAVDFAFQLDLLIVVVWAVPLGQAGFASMNLLLVWRTRWAWGLLRTGDSE